MKNMILGFYHVITNKRTKYNASSYPFFSNSILNNTDLIIVDNICKGKPNTVLETVRLALEKCDKCYFILDDVKFPLDFSQSYTCKELHCVLSNPQFFEKTVFILNNEVLNTW